MPTPQIQQIRAYAEAGKPEAQFLLSQICLQNKDIEGMVHLAVAGKRQGLPDALGALGQCFEKGQGMSRDMAAAMDHYDRAVAAGSSIAAIHKAQLLYKSRQGLENGHLIYELLVSAAARRDPVSSFMPAWCLLEGWGGDGSRNEAAQWLQQADLPEAKIQFGAMFSLYPEVQGVDHQIVSTDPPMTLFKDVLSIVDCAYLIFSRGRT